MSKLDSARRFLRRVLDPGREAHVDEPPPALPSPPRADEDSWAPDDEAEVSDEFQDLLDGLGAYPASEAAHDPRDAQLAELRCMLEALRPVGDELARVEQTRLELERRAADLEGRLRSVEASLEAANAELEELREAKDPDPSRREARLKRELEERAGVLERERERHAKTRRQRDERNQVAAERWRELRALRSRLRRFQSEGR